MKICEMKLVSQGVGFAEFNCLWIESLNINISQISNFWTFFSALVQDKNQGYIFLSSNFITYQLKPSD